MARAFSVKRQSGFAFTGHFAAAIEVVHDAQHIDCRKHHVAIGVHETSFQQRLGLTLGQVERPWTTVVHFIDNQQGIQR